MLIIVWGPEIVCRTDHLQRLDRMLAKFFDYLDKVGLDNSLVLLTADHGFSNTQICPRPSTRRHASRWQKIDQLINQSLQGQIPVSKNW